MGRRVRVMEQAGRAVIAARCRHAEFFPQPKDGYDAPVQYAAAESLCVWGFHVGIWLGRAGAPVRSKDVVLEEICKHAALALPHYTINNGRRRPTVSWRESMWA